MQYLNAFEWVEVVERKKDCPSHPLLYRELLVCVKEKPNKKRSLVVIVAVITAYLIGQNKVGQNFSHFKRFWSLLSA